MSQAKPSAQAGTAVVANSASEASGGEPSNGEPALKRRRVDSIESDQDKYALNESGNPHPQKESAPGDPEAGTNGDRICLVMVGLPARGKTYSANKISHYLKFFHGKLSRWRFRCTLSVSGRRRPKLTGRLARCATKRLSCRSFQQRPISAQTLRCYAGALLLRPKQSRGPEGKSGLVTNSTCRRLVQLSHPSFPLI